MRRSCYLPALLGLASLLLMPAAALGQPARTALLTGTVTDAETGRPLAGAHVFIAASTMGTATNEAGRFVLPRVPLGQHRLYVSMLGYEPAARDTLLRVARPHRLDLRLTPTVLEMGEVTVQPPDKRWRRRLKKFTRLFIGTSANADATTILNPEVLTFEGGWGRLRAEARAPLLIENQALGYRLRYHLKEFERRGNRIRYDGEPLFEELTPESPEQAAAWDAARRTAYYGSFRHFLLTVLAGQSHEEGFTTYRLSSSDDLGRPDRRWRLPSDRLLDEGPTPAERTLRFHGLVEILYTEEDAEDAFYAWQGTPYRGREPQRSWIELNDGPTAVDTTGEVVDPYGVTLYGYFAFEGIADLVPKEYRPE